MPSSRVTRSLQPGEAFEDGFAAFTAFLGVILSLLPTPALLPAVYCYCCCCSLITIDITVLTVYLYHFCHHDDDYLSVTMVDSIWHITIIVSFQESLYSVCWREHSALFPSETCSCVLPAAAELYAYERRLYFETSMCLHYNYWL